MQTGTERISMLQQAIPYFPQPIRQALLKLSPDQAQRIHEIRMRCGKPLGLGFCGNERFLCATGAVTDDRSQAILVTSAQLSAAFQAICEDSVHSFARELSQGYVTIAGGSRVGISATAVVQHGVVETVKYVNGLNFRIAGEVAGCAEHLCEQIFAGGKRSLLLIGEPASGKTTILRDLCRNLGERYRLSVVDERGELAAVCHGVAQNQLGCRTDVFDGYPKAIGMQTAIRVMSPDFVVCDEIGDEADAQALWQSMHAGVHILATAHAGSMEDAYARPHLKRLLDAGVFDDLALLDGCGRPGQIRGIRRVRVRA